MILGVSPFVLIACNGSVQPESAGHVGWIPGLVRDSFFRDGKMPLRTDTLLHPLGHPACSTPLGSLLLGRDRG